MHLPTTKLEDLARALTFATDGDLKELAATRRGLIPSHHSSLPCRLRSSPTLPTRSIRRRRKLSYLINTSGSRRCPTRRRSR